MGDEQGLRDALVAATLRNRIPDYVDYDPDLRRQRGWHLDGAGIRIGSNEDDRRLVIRMTISREGEGRLFCCCGSRVREGGPVSIYENVLAGNLAGFLSAAGTFYAEAGYIGAVDVGLAVTGLRWAHSHFVIAGDRMEERVEPRDGIDQADHRRTERLLASDLQERPHEVAEELLRDLFDALVGMRFTPFR
jgi:hypothetical protein